MKHLLTLLLLLPLAVAAEQDGLQSLDRIREAAIAAVQAGNPQLQVRAQPLDERLRLPECGDALKAKPEPGRRKRARVTVACGGPTEWTVYVALEVSEPRPVLTLARSVARGERLQPALLAAQEEDVTALPHGYYTDPAALAGMQLRRPATGGSVITPDMVEAPRLVRRGDLVTVVGRSGAVEVRSQGKALRDGGQGDRIPVENSSSRRVVEGRVTAGGDVEVTL